MLYSISGNSILAFPYILARVGIIRFMFLWTLFGIATFITSSMNIEIGLHKGILNYSLLTKDIFGPVTAQLLNMCMVLAFNGGIMSYLNVIGK